MSDTPQRVQITPQQIARAREFSRSIQASLAQVPLDQEYRFTAAQRAGLIQHFMLTEQQVNQLQDLLNTSTHLRTGRYITSTELDITVREKARIYFNEAITNLVLLNDMRDRFIPYSNLPFGASRAAREAAHRQAEAANLQEYHLTPQQQLALLVPEGALGVSFENLAPVMALLNHSDPHTRRHARWMMADGFVLRDTTRFPCVGRLATMRAHPVTLSSEDIEAMTGVVPEQEPDIQIPTFDSTPTLPVQTIPLVQNPLSEEQAMVPLSLQTAAPVIPALPTLPTMPTMPVLPPVPPELQTTAVSPLSIPTLQTAAVREGPPVLHTARRMDETPQGAGGAVTFNPNQLTAPTTTTPRIQVQNIVAPPLSDQQRRTATRLVNDGIRGVDVPNLADSPQEGPVGPPIVPDTEPVNMTNVEVPRTPAQRGVVTMRHLRDGHI